MRAYLLFIDSLGLLHLLFHLINALPQNFDLLLGLHGFASHLGEQVLFAAALKLLLREPPVMSGEKGKAKLCAARNGLDGFVRCNAVDELNTRM